MRSSLIFQLVLLAGATMLTPQVRAAAASRTEHVLAGELKRVDAAGKTIVVRTAGGAEEAVRLTERTTVRGVEKGGRASALAGKEGSHVTVHYTEEAGRNIGHALRTAGRAIK